MAKADKKLSTAKPPHQKTPAASYGKHPGGAPRTVSPTPDELIELGKEMVQWFLDNAGADHFTEFYSIHKHILRKDWNSLREKPEFSSYYETCRNIILKRLKSGSVKEGIAHRYLSLVDTELRDHEREIKKENAEINAAEQKSFTSDDEARLASLMFQIQSLQAKKSSS